VLSGSRYGTAATLHVVDGDGGVDLCAAERAATAGSNTVTSALRGALKEDARTRQEFLSLINAG
jgi:GTP cyclohydrolase I